jgi:DNA-binding CsgD family transcriptional regulator
MRAKSTAEFIDHCWNDEPDAALLQVDATGAATEDAISDLRQTLPAVQLIGICNGRQSGHGIGKLPAALVHQPQLDDAQEETEGEGPSLQSPLEPVPILEQAQVSTLTPREVEVLAHVSAGFTAAQIADRLGISHKTIDKHKQRIYSKLEVHSQTHAVSVALQRGILDRSYASVSQSGRSLPSA